MEQDHLLIIEVGDLFDEMECQITHRNELPVFTMQNHNTDAFLMDLYQAVGFRPEGSRDIEPNVRDVLKDCGVYFDVPEFSSLQRRLWLEFMDELMARFDAFKLYDSYYIHRYDYYRLHGDVLLLKLAEV